MKILATKKDVEKWQFTGLLKGLDEKEKYRMAFILEKVVKFMEENVLKFSESQMGMLLPLAARIFRMKPTMVNIDCYKLIKCIRDAKSIFEKEGLPPAYSNIDAEAEATFVAAELYLNLRTA